MFHRRKTSNPARTAPPSQSAALAATQAFRKNQDPNGTLSASAAAAALRSHTPPPTNPAHLQTKRMIRRGSNSSRGSDVGFAGSVASPGLQRRPSNGSMTERSFRSPSPNRPGVHVEADPYAPPVPALPNTLRSTGSHKRSSSMEPQARLMSPTPRRAGGRGMSVDTSSRTPQAERRAGDASQPSPIDTSGRRSVNFSRPMSPPMTPQPGSPVGQKSGRSGWFTAPVGANVKMRQDVNDIVQQNKAPMSVSTYQTQQALRNTADRPVHQNKNVGHALPPQGAALSKAVKGMDSSKHAVRYDPNTRTMRPITTDFDHEPEISSRLAAKVAQGMSPTVEQPPATTSLAAEIEKELSFPLPQQSPVSVRASGALAKQPSVVRENREEEEKYDDPPPPRVRPTVVTKDEPIKVRTQASHVRSNSLQPSDALEIGRGISQSPSRQTRFAESPVIVPDDVRHDPPPRSVSPAKPALKHSPASSIRTASPITRTKSISRDASVAGSDDGMKPGGKKAARVSFGQDAEIIPEPAATGLSDSKYAVRDPWDDDGHYEMSPRPDLPSFGSIRGRDRQVPSGEARPAEPSVTPSSSAINPVPYNGQSADHALGGILKDAGASRSAGTDGNANDPIPPVVTSVEGTGHMYDTDSSDDERQDARADPLLSPIQELETPGEEIVPIVNLGKPTPGPIQAQPTSIPQSQSSADQAAIVVPDIAVQPATPGLSEVPPSDEYAVVMPGGFAGSWDDDEASNSAPTATDAVEKTAPTVEHEVPITTTLPTEHVPQPAPDTIHEESSDNDSVYSDAEEELENLDQFASIDAVVESPMPTTHAVEIFPPTARSVEATPIKEEPNTDWTETTAYWSSLTKKQRDEIEEEAEISRIAVVPPAPAQLPRRKKKAPPPPPPVESYSHERVPGNRSEGRNLELQTMRHRRTDSDPASPKEEFHMRRSMRGPAPGPEPAGIHMKQSMRQGQTKSPVRDSQARRTPAVVQSVPAVPPPRTTMTKRQAPLNTNTTTTTLSKPTPRPTLVRSTSSGSESSFKRSRPASIMSDGGRYTMKRSMRGGPSPAENYSASLSLRSASPPARPAASNGVPSKRFSLRSLSPVGRKPQQQRIAVNPLAAQRPQSAAPTMRDASLRSSKSPTRFSLLGRNKDPRSSLEKPKPSRPTFKSRFSMDSDGDSPVARTKYVSRFADSDDEDDSPVGLQDLTPVRGIPRRIGEEDGESTDLDDESEGEVHAPPAKPVPAIDTTNGQPIGTAITTGTMRGLESSKHAVPRTNGTIVAEQPPQSPGKERRSFFGVGPWKKRSASVSSTQPRLPDTATPDRTAAAPSNDTTPASPLRTRPPKLQRKSTREGVPRTNSSDAWGLPLPPKMTKLMSNGDDAVVDDRPNTSEGTAAPALGVAHRPDVGNRRVTVDGSTGLNIPPQRELRFDEASIVDSSQANGVGASDKKGAGSAAGKKKKFGMLRRAFKLND